MSERALAEVYEVRHYASPYEPRKGACGGYGLITSSWQHVNCRNCLGGRRAEHDLLRLRHYHPSGGGVACGKQDVELVTEDWNRVTCPDCLRLHGPVVPTKRHVVSDPDASPPRTLGDHALRELAELRSAVAELAAKYATLGFCRHANDLNRILNPQPSEGGVE